MLTRQNFCLSGILGTYTMLVSFLAVDDVFLPGYHLFPLKMIHEPV